MSKIKGISKSPQGSIYHAPSNISFPTAHYDSNEDDFPQYEENLSSNENGGNLGDSALTSSNLSSSTQNSEFGDRTQTQDNQISDGGSLKSAKSVEKKGDEKGGMFNNFFKDRNDRKKLKQIKKQVKKENSKNPYHKYFLPQKHVEQAAAREGRESMLGKAKKDFTDTMQKKSDITRNINQSHSAENAEKLKGEFDKETEKQKQKSKSLWVELGKADIKRAMEGPTGCWKDCKGAFLTLGCVALIFVGGLFTTILKLCGIF